jgi:hypothetical protein
LKIIILSVFLIFISAGLAIQPSAFGATDQVTISMGSSLTNGTCSATSCFDPNVINVNVGKIPHFSTLTVTITNMSKVKSAVPEFPVAITPLIIALISIITLTRYSKLTEPSI